MKSKWIAHFIAWSLLGMLFLMAQWPLGYYIVAGCIMSFYVYLYQNGDMLDYTSRNDMPHKVEPYQQRYLGDTLAAQQTQRQYNYTPLKPLDPPKPDFDPSLVEIVPVDRQDQALLANAQGAIMQGCVLPSGKKVPDCKENESWIVRGNKLVRISDEEFFGQKKETSNEIAG